MGNVQGQGVNGFSDDLRRQANDRQQHAAWVRTGLLG